VNLKKLLFLLITTSALGGLSVVLTSLILGWGHLAEGKEILILTTWFFVAGLMFSIISQMGFFAYLMIHRFGLGIFKSHDLWNWVQVLLILFTFFDLVYLRYNAFGLPEESWLDYVMLPSIMLLIAFIVAYLKAKATKSFTFIPALFFTFVVTAIEVLPVLSQNDPDWIVLMLVSILVCNSWQLLVLHHLTETGSIKS
jgi:KinB signaling pathway activation protein